MNFIKTLPYTSYKGVKIGYTPMPYVNDVFAVIDASHPKRKIKAAIHMGDKYPPFVFYSDTIEDAELRLEYHLAKMGHVLLDVK